MTRMHDVVLDPLGWPAGAAGLGALVQAWYVNEGDRVKAGQRLADVRAAGMLVPVEAPCDGMLEEVLVRAGETFRPRHVLARLLPF